MIDRSRAGVGVGGVVYLRREKTAQEAGEELADSLQTRWEEPVCGMWDV